MGKTLGILGFGNMGSAIAKGLLKNGIMAPSELVVFDVYKGAARAAEELGAAVADSERILCEQADFILLAVKPNTAKATLEAAGDAIKGKALISIVAGVDYDTLVKWAGEDVRILRTMPNTPALVSAGAFGLSSRTTLTKEEQQTVERWLSAIGLVEWVSEELMDVVTGLSGGAPAYMALFLEALADGAVQQGLKRDVAYRLAAQTMLGTGKMVLETGMHPGALKDAVCSPGGTTIEGIRAAAIQAVVSSSEKSRKLK